MTDDGTSEQVRRQAAAYARQPSVWPAPEAPPPPGGRRYTSALRTFAAVVVLVAGPPVLLWWGFGNPIALLPSWPEIWSWFTDSGKSIGTDGLRIVLVWAGWLLWAVITVLLAGSLINTVAGWRLPRWRLPAPLHRLVFGVTGSAAVALLTAPNPATATPATPTGMMPAVSPAVALDARPTSAPLGSEFATVLVGEVRYEYRVRRRDTLSKIADVWLGDPDRWPEICALNKHRHFAVGGRLTDCDLIFPGWELRLPDDARPPAIAKPAPPRTAPQESSPTRTPIPSPTFPSRTATATPTPTRTAPDGEPADTPSPETPDRTGTDLVLPGGSIIPWALAVAISATAALVWLQRRRRYIPGSGEPVRELPLPVRAAQQHIHQEATDARPPAVTPEHLLPSGGVGLVGPGAEAASRGLIITAVTGGSPTDPDHQAEVIIDRATLTDLIGDAAIQPWPRLHITDDLDHALSLLDTRLLQRARILDEHSLTDLGTVRDRAPDEEALPPLVLITRADSAAPSQRARITFGLTHGLDITAVVLGAWPHGPTVAVAADGHTSTMPETPAGTVSDRLAVIDPATTVDLLTTIREAHTGEPAPTPITSSDRDNDPASAVDLADQQVSTQQARPPADATEAAVQLRVFGNPRIDDVVLPGRPLRRKAAELGVYLACHPDGADTDTIAEHLLPDARMRQAKQQVHTNASNLRHVLGRAGGPKPGGYLTKHGPDAKYRLDPATVRVDLWQLRDLVQRARLGSPPERTDLLRQACALYTAPLADGCDYEWIEPHRQQAQRWATEAHSMLAEDLLQTDPHAAARILDDAITLDRYNEELYRQAMRARHALRDREGIRNLHRALTQALNELDAEPTDSTAELAATLTADLLPE